MSTEGLERAFNTTRGIIANVKPDQLGNDTPCASWKVRDVINHVVGGSHWFAASVNAGEAPAFPDTDYASGDFLSAYDEGIKASLAAFGAEGALGKMLKLPFGEMPGMALMGLATTDTFTHGWDVAKATGQSTDLDPEQAEKLLAASQMMIQDSFRGADGQAPFGPKVEGGATAADRLAAFLGRTP